MLPFRFKTHMREKRGGLRSFNIQMEDLCKIGSDDFLEYMIRTKMIGIERALHIANTLTKKEQDELVKFADIKARKKDDIELQVLYIIEER